MSRRVRLGHVLMVVIAATSFAAVAVVMAATFAASPDLSGLAQLRWLLLAVWTLGLPPVWGLRLSRRLGRLVPARPSGATDLSGALAGLWLEFAALGLGAAVAALAVIRPLL
jgi:hypothetical protein